MKLDLPPKYFVTIPAGTILYHASSKKHWNSNSQRPVTWFMIPNRPNNVTKNLCNNANRSTMSRYLAGLYGPHIHIFEVKKEIKLFRINDFLKTAHQRYKEIVNIMSPFASMLENLENPEILRLYRMQNLNDRQGEYDNRVAEWVCKNISTARGIYSPPFYGKAHVGSTVTRKIETHHKYTEVALCTRALRDSIQMPETCPKPKRVLVTPVRKPSRSRLFPNSPKSPNASMVRKTLF